jgi:predicted NBD/HSP70 family sugar kinase
MSAPDPLGAPARPLLLRRLNERTVLNTIRERGPVSRAEIARIAGISKPTVSLALRALLDAGLVREGEADSDGPTYGAIFFEADPEAGAVLGVDIGARYVRATLADVTGAKRAREDVESREGSVDGIVAMIPTLARRLMRVSGMSLDRLACAVVGVPGVVDPDSGRVSLAENVPGLDGQTIGARLEEELGVAVQVVNDVNLAALGERDHGAGRGVGSFVFVSVGTGLGAGVVLGGELVYGSHGAAGELDFLRPAASESDPSAPAIRAYAAAVLDANPTVDRPAWLDTVEIFNRARRGESWARQVVDEVARRVSVHLIPIASIIDPELVVLGGGVGSNGDLLLPRLRELLREALPFPPDVVTSQLPADAVLEGALALGLPRAREWLLTGRE